MNRLGYFIVVKLLMNKYFVATFLFLVYLIFFDRFNIPTQVRRYNETREIERYRQFYTSEIEKNHNALAELQSGLEAVERFGRETYYMKRENEEIFIIEPDE